jgi:hypothetical protein
LDVEGNIPKILSAVGNLKMCGGNPSF